jgi:hypothetical protein
LVLISGRIRTIIQDEVTAQWVTFSVKPQNAIVTIDDTPYGLQSDGTVSRFLPYGTHSYRIDAPGFISENGVVDVGREQIMREVTLKSSMGTVTLECSMKEAKIYLNGNLVGTGSWTGELESGMYQVEIKRDGHRSRTTSFMIQPKDEKTISLPVPQPIYGTISVTSDPIGATVLVDGVEVGKTPLLKGEILIGKHKVEFHKPDYRPEVMEVEVKEGELTSFQAELSDVFNLSVTSQPSGATLNIDGNYKGITPYKGEFSSGDYVVGLSKSGYAMFKKRIHLDASNPNLNISLQRKRFSKTNVYAAVNYQMGHITASGGYLGLYLGGFNLEYGYQNSNDRNFEIWWMDNTSSWNGSEGLKYYYYLACSHEINVGYGILCNNKIRFTPRLGVLVNDIIGDDRNYSNNDEETFVFTGRVGLRAEYSPVPHLGIICTPSYDIPVSMGNIASQLDANTSYIKKWCSGFAVNFGVEFYF